MIIFRTHPDHLAEVVRLSQYALATMPRIDPGDQILIAQTVTKTYQGPRIRYVMYFTSISPDLSGETMKIWGKRWKYIVIGKGCRELARPFSIQAIQTSDRNYGQGGPYVHVLPADEQIIREQGYLD
jgi:hypothetical protein